MAEQVSLFSSAQFPVEGPIDAVTTAGRRARQALLTARTGALFLGGFLAAFIPAAAANGNAALRGPAPDPAAPGLAPPETAPTDAALAGRLAAFGPLAAGSGPKATGLADAAVALRTAIRTACATLYSGPLAKLLVGADKLPPRAIELISERSAALERGRHRAVFELKSACSALHVELPPTLHRFNAAATAAVRVSCLRRGSARTEARRQFDSTASNARARFIFDFKADFYKPALSASRTAVNAAVAAEVSKLAASVTEATSTNRAAVKADVTAAVIAVVSTAVYFARTGEKVPLSGHFVETIFDPPNTVAEKYTVPSVLEKQKFFKIDSSVFGSTSADVNVTDPKEAKDRKAPTKSENTDDNFSIELPKTKLNFALNKEFKTTLSELAELYRSEITAIEENQNGCNQVLDELKSLVEQSNLHIDSIDTKTQ